MIQETLFKRQANHGYPAAILSSCGLYRYTLTRGVGHRTDYVNFVMLNPSTADAVNNDPTIRRCMGYAKDWGYADLIVTNLFAWRSTDPKALRNVADPVGPENDRYIVEVAKGASTVIAAWGNHGTLHGRDVVVRRLLAEAGIPLHCLTVSPGSGQPAHPLYQPACLMPRKYEGGQGR